MKPTRSCSRTLIDFFGGLELGDAGGLLDLPLDVRDELVGLVRLAVDEHPARALGHVPAHEQDADAEHRAEAEREAPADVGGEDVLVEQHDRQGRARGRAEPERAIDDQVDGAAHAGRDQLVDGGVDRRVLAADAGAGEEAADREERGTSPRTPWRPSPRGRPRA